MTLRILLSGAVLALSLSVAAQGITNSGFESWSTTVLDERLSDWTTSEQQVPGLNTIAQVPGASGSFGVRLETRILGNDTVFGYALLGNIDGNAPVAGVPFTTAIDAIEGFYRYDLQPGDSAVVLVGIWSFGVLAVVDVHTIGGTQAAWTAFDLPVNQGVPIAPDSVVVAFASSNPFAPAGIADGSWIEVDAVRLTSFITPAPDVLPNHEFELWDEVTSEDPDGWSSFNALLAPYQLASVIPSTQAHSGALSARITTLGVGNDTIPGILTNGTVTGFGVSGGVPYADLPGTMNAWVQYQPSGQDTARILALFMNGGVPVGSAYAEVTGPTSGWTLLSAPAVVMFTPDTLLLTVFSGTNPGSVLWVDDVDLSGGNVGLAQERVPAARVYPVPADDALFVDAPVGAGLKAWVLRDVQGRELSRGRFATPHRASIDVRGLPSGPGLLELDLTDGSRRMERFVKR
ncbi:MAG: hypothetical protein IPJ87_12480 [Flavobacteriales bacterium]|nr:hypothetical protein [Flavobacteriales bacterium]MBK9698928.1 hypothetical protein [Flavobacteriales bacterium]